MANKKKNNRKKKAAQQTGGNNTQIDSTDKHETEDILNEDTTTSTPTINNDNHENHGGANDEVEKPTDEGSNDEIIDAPKTDEIVTVKETAEIDVAEDNITEVDVTEDNVTKIEVTEDDIKDISEEDNKESTELELNAGNSPESDESFKDISAIASSDAESDSYQQEESKLGNDNVSIPSDEQDDVNRSSEVILTDEEHESITKSESEPKWIDEQEKDTVIDYAPTTSITNVEKEEEIPTEEVIHLVDSEVKGDNEESNTNEVAIAEKEDIHNIETVEPTLTDEQKEKSTEEENEIINSQESNTTGNHVEAEVLPKETAVDPALTDKEDIEEPAPEELNENLDKQFQEKTEEPKVELEPTPTLVDAKVDIQSETKGELTKEEKEGEETSTTATIEKSSNQNFYSLEALMKPIDGVEWGRREEYLSDDDFKCHLGVSKEEFAGMAKWKQQSIKKKAGIF